MKQKYTYWRENEMWLGYFDEYPDYWTQGETEAELKNNLIDIYKELTRIYSSNTRFKRNFAYNHA